GFRLGLRRPHEPDGMDGPLGHARDGAVGERGHDSHPQFLPEQIFRICLSDTPYREASSATGASARSIALTSIVLSLTRGELLRKTASRLLVTSEPRYR